MGWRYLPWNRTEIERIPDLAKYPELVWLDRYHVVPVVLYALVWTLAAGWHGLLFGFALPSVLIWHATFAVNSLAHWRGSRRFKTIDESKNNPLLAIIMLGEGWHNNHHFYCKSTRQGFYWWELDVTYLILRAMALVGLVHDIHEPPPHVLALGRGEKLVTKRVRLAREITKVRRSQVGAQWSDQPTRWSDGVGPSFRSARHPVGHS